MSYASEQKNDILSRPCKGACCRRALLTGALYAKGEIAENGEVSLRVDKDETAAFLSSLIHEFFGKEPSPERPKEGGRCRVLNFRSPAASKLVSSFVDAGSEPYVRKCDLCRGAFFRGIFLACGRMTDPKKQYCLEFSSGSANERLLLYLSANGVRLGVSHKKNETVLYTRNSSVIEDFFALAGMNETAFDVMNSKIEGEYRENANRIANCETGNIAKAVNATYRTYAVLRRLSDEGLLSLLPEELSSVVAARLARPDLSLYQLSATLVPKMSKSGLSHRLARASALAEEILKTHGKEDPANG